MHIVDTLETAFSFGLNINPPGVEKEYGMRANIEQNPYFIQDFETIFQYWLPLAYSMNSINRAMGGPDLYPFVISAPVKQKLAFVHKVIHSLNNIR